MAVSCSNFFDSSLNPCITYYYHSLLFLKFNFVMFLCMGEKEKCNQYSLYKKNYSRSRQIKKRRCLQESMSSAHQHRRIFWKIDRKSRGLILMQFYFRFKEVMLRTMKKRTELYADSFWISNNCACWGMDLGCVREPNASHNCSAKWSVKEVWDSCIDFQGGIDTPVQYSDHKRCVDHVLEQSEVLQELAKNHY